GEQEQEKEKEENSHLGSSFLLVWTSPFRAAAEFFTAPLGGAIAQGIQEVKPILMGVIAEHEASGEDGANQIVVKAEQIIELLVGRKLANAGVWLKCTTVGTRPSNRFGAGLEIVDVHDLMKVIVEGGFRHDACQGAACFEIAPGGAMAEQHWAFNGNLATSSGGFLPRFDASDLKLLSVACSHTVAGARCVELGAPDMDEKFNDDSGRICRAKVLAKCSSYEQPLTRGMPWTVIRHEVGAEMPELARFLQEAVNANSGAGRQQTNMQTFLQIHKTAKQNIETLGYAKWESIQLHIERTRPHLSGQVADMSKHVELYPGGDSGSLLYELRDNGKTVGDRRRGVHGSYFGMLARVGFMQCPEYITACVAACLFAPDQHCRDGVARLLNSTDMAVIRGSKKRDAPAFPAPTAVIKSFFAADPTLSNAQQAELLGILQGRWALFSHNEQVKGRKKRYSSINAIKDQFLDELLMVDYGVKPPWSRSEQVSSAPKEAVGNFVEFTATFSGAAISDGAPKASGFVVGAAVALKTDKCQGFAMMGVSSGAVSMSSVGSAEAPTSNDREISEKRKAEDDEGDGSKVEISSSQLVDEYEVAPVNSILRIPVGSVVRADKHKDAVLEKTKAQVVQRPICDFPCAFAYVRHAVADAHARRSEGLELSAALDKKARGVVADASHAKGELTLVPQSASMNAAPKMSNGSDSKFVEFMGQQFGMLDHLTAQRNAEARKDAVDDIPRIIELSVQVGGATRTVRVAAAAIRRAKLAIVFADEALELLQMEPDTSIERGPDPIVDIERVEWVRVRNSAKTSYYDGSRKKWRQKSMSVEVGHNLQEGATAMARVLAEHRQQHHTEPDDQRLISMLRGRIAFVNAQAHAGLDRNSLAQAQVNALNASFAAPPGVGFAAAAAVAQEISKGPWTQQQNISMATTLNSRAEAASGTERAGVGRAQQKRKALQLFFTADDWRAIANYDHSEIMKMHVVANGTHKLGISTAREKLLMRGIAIVVCCRRPVASDGSCQEEPARGPAEAAEGSPCCRALAYTHCEFYPAAPNLLTPAAVFGHASADGQPVLPPVELDQLEVEFSAMRYRCSSKALGGSSSAAVPNQPNAHDPAALAVPVRPQQDPLQLLMMLAAQARGGLGAPGMPNMFGAGGSSSNGGCSITFTRPPQEARSVDASLVAAGVGGESQSADSPPTSSGTPALSPIAPSPTPAASPELGASVLGAAGIDAVEKLERHMLGAAGSSRQGAAKGMAKGKAKAKAKAKAKGKAKAKAHHAALAAKPSSHAIDYSQWLKPVDAKSRSENAFASRAYDAAKRLAVSAGMGNVDCRAVAKEACHKEDQGGNREAEHFWGIF
ncbi:unnamed protein product, partial [Prorocentrum cordatum]